MNGSVSYRELRNNILRSYLSTVETEYNFIRINTLKIVHGDIILNKKSKPKFFRITLYTARKEDIFAYLKNEINSFSLKDSAQIFVLNKENNVKPGQDIPQYEFSKKALEILLSDEKAILLALNIQIYLSKKQGSQEVNNASIFKKLLLIPKEQEEKINPIYKIGWHNYLDSTHMPVATVGFPPVEYTKIELF